MPLGLGSNIRILLAEARHQLEKSQRLRNQSRTALARLPFSTRRHLSDMAARGGAKAASCGHGQIEPGGLAGLLALEMSHPDLAGLPRRNYREFCLCWGHYLVAEVWSTERHLKCGTHLLAFDAICQAYHRAVVPLRNASLMR